MPPVLARLVRAAGTRPLSSRDRTAGEREAAGRARADQGKPGRGAAEGTRGGGRGDGAAEDGLGQRYVDCERRLPGGGGAVAGASGAGAEPAAGHPAREGRGVPEGGRHARGARQGKGHGRQGGSDPVSRGGVYPQRVADLAKPANRFRARFCNVVSLEVTLRNVFCQPSIPPAHLALDADKSERGRIPAARTTNRVSRGGVYLALRLPTSRPEGPVHGTHPSPDVKSLYSGPFLRISA
eukprot:1196294-Prorocentrum_minimum.AAC.11